MKAFKLEMTVIAALLLECCFLPNYAFANRFHRASSDSYAETSNELRNIYRDSKYRLDEELRQKFEMLLTQYPEIKSQLKEFEIVFCVNRQAKITHIFWLGLKGIPTELLTEALISMEDSESLLLPDFFCSGKEEVDVRFSYPEKSILYPYPEVDHFNESHYRQAILAYKLNQRLRKNLSEYCLDKKVPVNKIEQFQIIFQRQKSGSFEVISISSSSDYSEYAKRIIQELPTSFPPAWTENKRLAFKHFHFAFPQAFCDTSLNRMYDGKGFNNRPNFQRSSTPSYKEYIKRRPKHLKD